MQNLELTKSNNQYTTIDEKIFNEIESLPDDFWDFRNEYSKESVHGLHTYPATMIYSISRTILTIVKKYQTITSLFDPFMGSGTVAVEGVLSNIQMVSGVDLNPLACILSKVKTTPFSPKENTSILDKFMINVKMAFIENEVLIYKFDEFIKMEKKLDVTAKDGWGNNAPNYLKEFFNNQNTSFDYPNFHNIGFWFLPKAIIGLQLIKNVINGIESETIKNFLLITFSETVRNISNTRNSEFKLYRIEAEKLFKRDINVEQEFFRILSKNISKMQNFYDDCAKNNINTVVNIYNTNTKYLTNIDDEFDLMITSPPYGDSRTTVAYGQFSRLSLQWLDLFGVDNKQILDIDKNLLGGSSSKGKIQWDMLRSSTLITSLEKISIHDEKRAYEVFLFYKELDESINAITKKMKANSYQFWVVGNRTVKLENLQTDKIIIELGQEYGLAHIHTFSRNICNKVMPSLNSPSNKTGEKVTTMTKENIVMLRKVE